MMKQMFHMGNFSDLQKPIKIYDYTKLEDRQPQYALVLNTDLVIIRYDDEVSVLYGRCLHRGALLADGYVADDGRNLICGVHQWDYQLKDGVSEYNKEEVLEKFNTVIHHRNCILYEYM